MIENIPLFESIAFVATTLLTIFLFGKAAPRSWPVVLILLAWISLQTIISLNKFYVQWDTIPPRFVIAVLPAMLTVVMLFVFKKGRQYVDEFNPAMLTLLHVVRIPVELVLFWLFLHQLVPEVMTFEGRNFDIISGITAPLVYYFGYVKNKLSTGILLLWNFACLALLFNIVIHAVLAAPFPFQRIAFDQPNVAVFYFPFIWLPSCVVPLVLFSHLACIRQLLKRGPTIHH